MIQPVGMFDVHAWVSMNEFISYKSIRCRNLATMFMTKGRVREVR